MTVRRRLHEAGLHCRVPAEKPALNDEHRAARLAFALRNVDQTEDYWNLTIFSDEKNYRSDVDGRMVLWRPPCTR